MSDFRRFSEAGEGDPARALFRSMQGDGPAPGRKGEVLAAALAAAATASVAATATAAVSGAAAASAKGVSGATAIATATVSGTPSTVAVLPVASVSIVKMIGFFVLGGTVAASGLMIGTQVFDPPAPRPMTGTVVGTTAPLAMTIVAPSHPARAVHDEGKMIDEVAPPPVDSALAAAPPSAPLAVPSARADRSENGELRDPREARELAEPVAAPVSATTARAETSLADEVASLDGARRALSSGDGAGALRALDVFQGKFPRARLGTEALVLRVEALVASGRAAEARGLGEPFLSAHSDSPFAPRVRRAIGQKENVLTIP